MSRHATFENFGMAFLTLFQVSTGDNWNGIMKVHVRGLGRENRAEGRVLRVSAPEPSACPVPGRTQKGGAGNRDAEGPARGPRGKGGGGEASVGSPSAPKCCSRASAQILGDRTPPRARGSAVLGALSATAPESREPQGRSHSFLFLIVRPG